jgi:nicotinamidase-related amidase
MIKGAAEMGGQALVIVDMLNDFLTEQGALFVGAAGQRIVPVIAAELERARQGNLPVLFLCDQHRPDDQEFTLWPPHCVAGSRGAQVIPELAVRPGDYLVPKRRYSGFYGTDLDLILRELGISELILTGVCTNICVLYTAADARMRNFKVTVVKDGVASFDEQAHRFALGEMEKTLGVMVAGGGRI